MSGNTSKIISNFNPLRYVAESEAAKVAAVAELNAYAQERITAGDNVSEVNAKLSAAKAAVYAAKTVAEVTSAKNAGLASMKPTRGYENGYEWVDLGLPSGTKWATSDLVGNQGTYRKIYFQWGQIDNFTGYDHEPYEEKNNYHTASNTLYYTGETLIPEDDAAHILMGGQWRIPTEEEFEEFLTNCTMTSVVSEHGSTVLFTSNINGNKIYFPANGMFSAFASGGKSMVEYSGQMACYQASTCKSDGSTGRGYRIMVSIGFVERGTANLDGLCIRPVCK